MLGRIEVLKASEAVAFLLPRHYSGRKPQISIAFGWFINDELVAVCSFGKPASRNLCFGICGKEHEPSVYELNRLCRVDELKEQLSQFVSACLRRLRANNWIVVSYSDCGMNHNGYIYQACNFMFTGTTKGRTDKYTEGNKHSRHYSNDDQNGMRKVRTPKNRYVMFCTFDKKLKKEWLKSLSYPVLPYPKAENKNYVLGNYQKQQIVLTGGVPCQTLLS
jgi:hypothetical protein